MPLSKVWAGSLVLLAAVSYLPLQAASPLRLVQNRYGRRALLGNIILQVLESHGVPTVK